MQDGGDINDFSSSAPPPPLSAPVSESPTETFPTLIFTVRVSLWTECSEPHPRLPNGTVLLEGRSGEDLTLGSPGVSCFGSSWMWPGKRTPPFIR